MARKVEQKSGGLTFLVVKHNTVCEESKVEREGFQEIEVFNPKTKSNQTKWIDPWPSVEGYVNGIEYYDTSDTYETTFKGFKINIDDEVVLDLPQKTAAHDTFCKLAENIDFSQEVNFSAYYNKKKERMAFKVMQNGANVDWKYTIDNPNGCPPWKKDEDGEWDSREQRAFLKKQVIDVVIPMVEKAAEARKGASVTSPTDAIAEAYAADESPKAKAATATAGKSKTKKEDTLAEDTDLPF